MKFFCSVATVGCLVAATVSVVLVNSVGAAAIWLVAAALWAGATMMYSSVRDGE